MLAGLRLSASSLAALLAALGIPGPAVERLMLQHCALLPDGPEQPLPALHGGGSGSAGEGLSAAHRLILSHCTGSRGSLLSEGGVGELMQGMPQLQTLNLLGLESGPEGPADLTALPACVAQRTSLRVLQASRCGLDELPSGPYLDGEGGGRG